MTLITHLLSPAHAADYLDITHHALARHRRKGTGPRYYDAGRAGYFYSLPDLEAWTPPPAEPQERPAAPFVYPVELLHDEYQCWGRRLTAEYLGISVVYLDLLRKKQLDPPALPQEWVQRGAVMYPRGAVEVYLRVSDESGQYGSLLRRKARELARQAAEDWVTRNQDQLPPPPPGQAAQAGGAR